MRCLRNHRNSACLELSAQRCGPDVSISWKQSPRPSALYAFAAYSAVSYTPMNGKKSACVARWSAAQRSAASMKSARWFMPYLSCP